MNWKGNKSNWNLRISLLCLLTFLGIGMKNTLILIIVFTNLRNRN